VCQDDLGFGGPGSAVLTVCGDELYGGQSAELMLTGAPPDADAWILISNVSNPTSMFGGTLVPIPSTGVKQVQTDALGQYTSPVVGGLGEAPLYMQMYVEDPMQTEGYVISNAVRVQSHRTNLKAIRDGRYKLVLNAYSCTETFFDLDLDPFETNDLLGGVLTPQEQASYDALRERLDDMLRQPKRGYQAFWDHK